MLLGGVQVGREGIRKDFYPNVLQPFLENITEEAVTTETGRLIQYFTTLIENADPLLRRWLATWSTF